MQRQPKKPLSVHVGLAIAEVICITAFAVELSRAISGNTLSWAYVFEWPVLGGYGLYMWHRLGRDDSAPSTTASEADEKSRRAYNEYLERVHDNSLDGPDTPVHD